MFLLFSKEKTADIYIDPFASEGVKWAAFDLRENLLALSGKEQGFNVSSESTGQEIVIKTDSTLSSQCAEGYLVTVKEDGVEIVGYDILGTVYGIYAFCTKCLGIDPMYRFTDIFPPQREELQIKPKTIVSKKRSARFRGWFINDEDFLSGFAPSGAKRRITYNQAFFKEVLSTQMIGMVCETALRLEMNTLIPCSFVDILNPAEEDIVRTVTARGMYISQHHQEPVGVAYFAAENYMREHYPNKSVSYYSNPDEMKEIWTVYVKHWAKYGKQVIWQLGLRGKGDRAVWQSDGGISSSAEIRGEIISSAIAAQYEIISQALGHSEFLSTTTLWLEGAELYDRGYLRVPDSTITVFSDIGDTQLFGGDFYSVTRRENCQYGIYYHAGFYVEGPHYCDGTDPEKMVFCYREAQTYNSLYFSILNVANIRELCSSIRLNAAILEGSPEEFDLEAYYGSVYPTLYGEASHRVVDLEKRFFASIGDLGDEMAEKMIALTDFHYFSIPDLKVPYYPLTDGTLIRIGMGTLGFQRRKTCNVFLENEEYYNRVYREITESANRFEALLPEVEDIEKTIPWNALSHYRFAIRYKINLMLRFCRWAACCLEIGKGRDVEKNKASGAAYLQEILDMREEFNRGKWQGWYDCDMRQSVATRIAEILSADATDNYV